MSIQRGMLGAAAVLLASMGGAAAASDNDLALFGRDPGTDRVFACYTRHYDKAHLAGHPKQNVVDMTLFVTSYDEGDSGRQYLLSMGVRFRTAPTLFQVSGACNPPADGSPGLGCGIDCDGGSYRHPGQERQLDPGRHPRWRPDLGRGIGGRAAGRCPLRRRRQAVPARPDGAAGLRAADLGRGRQGNDPERKLRTSDAAQPTRRLCPPAGGDRRRRGDMAWRRPGGGR